MQSLSFALQSADVKFHQGTIETILLIFQDEASQEFHSDFVEPLDKVQLMVVYHSLEVHKSIAQQELVSFQNLLNNQFAFAS
jgi:hypothetical protein